MADCQSGSVLHGAADQMSEMVACGREKDRCCRRGELLREYPPPGDSDPQTPPATGPRRPGRVKASTTDQIPKAG